MAGAIDELYVALKLQNTQMVDGFITTGRMGDEMAAKVVAACDEVSASVAKMAESSQISLGEIDKMAVVTADEIKMLALQTEEASAKMEAAQLKAAEANKTLDGTMTNSQATFKSVRTGATLGAAAFTFLGIETIKAAGNYESSTQKIVSSGGEIQANIDKVRQGMLDMTTQVGYSADELSSAFYKASSAGFNYANGGLKVLQASAEGAKTEQADLTLVTDAVTSAMVDYHYKADQAAMVTTKMVAATSAGKMSFQDLAGALHSILPIASAAGVSFNDILGDLAAMTVHGESADQAAQNLSDTIKHMLTPTSTQAKELGILHMTTNQLADDLKSKGLSGTLQEISTRIKTFTLPGSDKVILDLRNALNGLSGPVRELGMHLFDGSMSMKEYSKAAGALDPISAKQALSFATLAGSMHRIGDQQMSGAQVMQNYGSALYKATGDSTALNVALMLSGDNAGNANDAIKTVTDSTTEAGNHVKGWAEIQKTFNQRLSDAKAGFGALTIEVGTKLLPIATKFMGWLTDGVKWLERHKTVAQALAIGIGILAGAFILLSIAMWAASITPIGLLIAAIMIVIIGLTILIYELLKHWHLVWDKGIWALMKAIGHWFAHDFAGFFEDMYHKVKKWIDEVHDWIWGKWDDLVSFVSKIPQRLTNAAKGMWDGIKDAFRGALNWIIDKWNGLHFKIPSFSFMGVSTPGFTLGVPTIPRLAEGGYFPAMAGGTLGILGEAGQNEYALPEPKLADLLAQAASMGGGGGVTEVHVYIDGTEMKNTTMRLALREKLRSGHTFLT